MSPPTTVAPPAPRSSPRRSRPPARLDRARDQRQPQVGRDCSTSGAALVLPGRGCRVELVLMRVQLIVPENTPIRPRDLQPHHVDVRGHRRGPVRDPAGPRADRLHLPAPGGLSRCRVPAAQPAVVLALRGRRLHHLRQLPVAPLRGRLGGLPAALRAALLQHPRRRRLDRRHRARAARLRLLRGQPGGHAAQHAGARDGLAPRPAFTWAADLGGYLLLSAAR